MSRTVKAAWGEITKPDTFVEDGGFGAYVRDYLFPAYVRDYLFPKDHYLLLQSTYDYESNKNDLVENTREPDFKFKSLKAGVEFFVEARFHSNYYAGAVEWCKPHQLRRYKEIGREIPVFVVIGVGEQPRAPGEIFLVPVKDIEDSKLFRSFLVQYALSIGHSTVDSHLRRKLFGIPYPIVNEVLQKKIF